jgi:hypothetical protein
MNERKSFFFAGLLLLLISIIETLAFIDAMNFLSSFGSFFVLAYVGSIPLFCSTGITLIVLSSALFEYSFFKKVL